MSVTSAYIKISAFPHTEDRSLLYAEEDWLQYRALQDTSWQKQVVRIAKIDTEKLGMSRLGE